jgi:hypothetical protein
LGDSKASFIQIGKQLLVPSHCPNEEQYKGSKETKNDHADGTYNGDDCSGAQ